MRHNKKFNHLGRKSAHRKAMLSNMATSLIMHKRIATTLAKAKALRVYVEPLLTKAKEDTTNSRRTVFSHLRSKEVIKELYGEVSQKIAERPGGYTRILRTGFRLGDNAEMCIIELVDYNENMLKDTTQKKARTRRSGRKSSAVTSENKEVKNTAKIAEKTNTKSATEEPKSEVETVLEEMKATTIDAATAEIEPATDAEESKKE
jgi:large subunit ribosomal protein L17